MISRHIRFLAVLQLKSNECFMKLAEEADKDNKNYVLVFGGEDIDDFNMYYSFHRTREEILKAYSEKKIDFCFYQKIKDILCSGINTGKHSNYI